MPYIGTIGDIDPNYRTRQLQNFGESVGSAFQLALSTADRKKREAQAERDRELQRFATLAESFPDAAVTFGESLATKYGEELPYLRGMVDALKERTSVRDQAKKAGEQWMQRVETAEAPLREIVANPQDWRAPLLTPETAAGRIPQLPGETAGQLPFAEREAARLWAKSRGIPFPEPPTAFDPYKHLEQGQKALHAQRTGAWNVPGAAEAAEIGVGLRPGASAELSAEIQREQGVRSEARAKLDAERVRLSAERLELDRAKEARIASEPTAEGGGKKANPAQTAKEVAGWIESDSKLLAAEWDAGLKETDPEGKPSAAERETYIATNGPRPQPLLKSQSNLVARKVTDAIIARGEEATPVRVQEEVEVIMAAYRALLASGKTREQAMRALLGGGG